MQRTSWLVMAWCAVVCSACGDEQSASGTCDPNPCQSGDRTACFSDGADGHVCACGAGLLDDGAGGCVERPTSADGTDVDWSQAEPKYTGRFRVTDIFGVSVKDAQVRHAGVMTKTNDTGRARLRDLPAKRDTTIQVRTEQHVPHVRSIGFDNAGQREAHFVVTPEAAARAIDPTKPNVVEMPSVSVSLPADGLMTRDGSRPSGNVSVRATSIDRELQGARALPGLSNVLNERGRAAPMRRMHAIFRVEMTDEDEAEVTLRPGKQATATIALPSDITQRDGDRLALYSLNELTGRWHREASCRVQRSEADPRKMNARTNDCVGAVPHFSTWAVGEEWDIYAPGELGCVNASITWDLPQGVRAAHVAWDVLECDGDVCAPGVWSNGDIKYLPATDDGAHSLCGLAGSGGQSYRWWIEVDLEVDSDAQVTQRSGRYYYVHDFDAPPSFSDMVGAELALNQELDPTEDCRSLCAQQTLALDLDALGDAAYVDADGDGWFVHGSDGDANALVSSDCDDNDGSTYPGAPESLCSGRDSNCDGELYTDSSAPSWQEVPDAFRFNYHCSESCVTTAAEISGNLYDEDCDGRVDDMDGDGINVESGDCDDWNPLVNVDQAEVPGNELDDNCDGATLDRDNDGYYAWEHEGFAAELGIDAEANPERFDDCVDFDATIHPGVDVDEEVGQLAEHFYVDALGDVRRAASFCGYFDADGTTSALFHQLRDRNCDGVVSDLDGDGFTVPSDRALGAENAIDCNDVDLRVIPTPADAQAGIAAMCDVPAASELINDAECMVDLEAFGNGSLDALADACPTRLGGFIETNCWAIDDAGTNLCLYLGWESQLPLKWRAGVLWGACDETGGGLPDCPSNALCAGPLPYTDAFTDYLTERYTAPLSQNTCFQTCDNPIGSLSSM